MSMSFRLSFFYVAVFMVVGITMPYWPIWLASNGLDLAQIGLVLALPVWLRIIINPVVTAAVDRIGRRKLSLIILSGLSLLSYQLYFFVGGFWSIALVAILVGLTQTSLLPLGDNITLIIARYSRINYGTVRVWGSVSFIFASVVVGWMLTGSSEQTILIAIVAALTLVFIACCTLPDIRPPSSKNPDHSALSLMKQPMFLVFLATIGLSLASHGVLYGFATLHWQSLGIDDASIGVYWALSVIAEIILFALAPKVNMRLTAVQLIIIGILCGLLRWIFMGITTSYELFFVLQFLHAGSFGATHLGTMAFLTSAIPVNLSARAQGLFSATAGGAIMGLGLLASGYLYEVLGQQAYFVMAAISCAALILALVLNRHWSGGLLLKR